ncbi:MAG: hypothetical protein ABF292_10175, partial [Desulfobacterales bacterium]
SAYPALPKPVSPGRQPRQSLNLDVHIFGPPAGSRWFLYGPILHGTTHQQDKRSVRQFTGGVAVVFSYLA